MKQQTETLEKYITGIVTEVGWVGIYLSGYSIMAFQKDEPIGFMDTQEIEIEGKAVTVVNEIFVEERFRRNGIAREMAIAAEGVFNDYYLLNDFTADGAKFWRSYLSPNDCLHLIAPDGAGCPVLRNSWWIAT